MSTKETGGAAFPEECNGQIFGGITKRDYFAAKAYVKAKRALHPGGLL